VGSQQIRAAAAQFHVGSDIAVNLESCLRVLDKAAAHKPQLVVLPEFCNHLSWYDNAEHCFDVSLTLDGDFLQAIATKAKEIQAFVVIGVTLQRDNSKVSGSNLLYSPTGELLGISDKQVLIGHENDFLEPATTPGAVVDTEIGRLGLYMCMDGVINETPRCLSLRGAQVLCNSLNSFAPDEGSLHIPVRAPENRVFVVAANKVGPLVPEAMMDGISAATNIPVEFLNGAGESQIVAPDGTVLAMAKTRDEEVVFADFCPSDADSKTRPDGTDVYRSRRPELYASLGLDPAEQAGSKFTGPEKAEVATLQLAQTGFAALEEALSAIANSGASLIVLPGLCLIDAAEGGKAIAQSESVINAIAAQCGDSLVATSLVQTTASGERQHCAVLIGSQGLVFAQPQVHFSERFAWSALAEGFASYDSPIGRIGLMVSDDSVYPESARLLALQGVQILAVPLMPLEAWELETGLLERAGENRMNLVAAAQPSAHGCSTIGALQRDFTIFGEWQERAFDGVLTRPVVTQASTNAGLTTAEIYPRCAENKVVSHRTHLLDNRPWHLLAPITAAH